MRKLVYLLAVVSLFFNRDILASSSDLRDSGLEGRRRLTKRQLIFAPLSYNPQISYDSQNLASQETLSSFPSLSPSPSPFQSLSPSPSPFQSPYSSPVKPLKTAPILELRGKFLRKSFFENYAIVESHGMAGIASIDKGFTAETPEEIGSMSFDGATKGPQVQILKNEVIALQGTIDSLKGTIDSLRDIVTKLKPQLEVTTSAWKTAITPQPSVTMPSLRRSLPPLPQCESPKFIRQKSISSETKKDLQGRSKTTEPLVFVLPEDLLDQPVSTPYPFQPLSSSLPLESSSSFPLPTINLACAQPQGDREEKGWLQADNETMRQAALATLKSGYLVLDLFKDGLINFIYPLSENSRISVFKYVAHGGLHITLSGKVSVLPGTTYNQVVIKPEWKALIDSAQKGYNVSASSLSNLEEAIRSEKYDNLSPTDKAAITTLLGEVDRELSEVISAIKILEENFPLFEEGLSPDGSSNCTKNYKRAPALIKFNLGYLQKTRFFLEDYENLEYAFKRSLAEDIRILSNAFSQALALFPKEPNSSSQVLQPQRSFAYIISNIQPDRSFPEPNHTRFFGRPFLSNLNYSSQTEVRDLSFSETPCIEAIENAARDEQVNIAKMTNAEQ